MARSLSLVSPTIVSVPRSSLSFSVKHRHSNSAIMSLVNRLFKVAIIQNYTTDKPWGTWMIDSIKANIRRTFPDADIGVYNAEAGDTLPDESTLDLIILTGGTYNLLESKLAPWVVGIMNLVKRVAEADSGPYLIGLCWGHQVINVALGGNISVLKHGAMIGVEKIALSESGQEVFSRDNLSLHKYHLRAVSTPAPGFEVLGKGNEILMNRNKGILTLQAHPEMTYEISKSLVDHDTGLYRPRTDLRMDVQLCGIDASHDGFEVWNRIMAQVTMNRKR